MYFIEGGAIYLGEIGSEAGGRNFEAVRSCGLRSYDRPSTAHNFRVAAILLPLMERDDDFL